MENGTAKIFFQSEKWSILHTQLRTLQNITRYDPTGEISTTTWPLPCLQHKSAHTLLKVYFAAIARSTPKSISTVIVRIASFFYPVFDVYDKTKTLNKQPIGGFYNKLGLVYSFAACGMKFETFRLVFHASKFVIRRFSEEIKAYADFGHQRDKKRPL